MENCGKRGISWHGGDLFHERGRGGTQPHLDNDVGSDDKRSTLVVDHIANNCKTQGVWAAAINIDAIVFRAGLLLPCATKLCTVSDNARTYRNYIISVMVTFICRAYGFHLEGLMDPETTRRRSLVDTHVTISMRQVIVTEGVF